MKDVHYGHLPLSQITLIFEPFANPCKIKASRAARK